ncbi:hypothetical protein HDV01_002220 [Terramyces sp. JEL0728]|nr:hypothetical protein HDV01_002220 [Terramyces sp. JEL0728]
MILILLLTGFICCLKNTNADPLLNKFEFLADTFDDSLGYQYYWSVLNLGTPNETIHGAMVFNATQYSLDTPNTTVEGIWFGMAFGQSMLTGEFLIAYCKEGETKPTVIEAVNPGGYAPPIASPNNKVFNLVSMTQVCDLGRNVAIVEFTRLTSPNDGLHRNLDVTRIPQLWAFNLQPDPAGKNGWMYWHGKYRGRTFINYLSSDINLSISDGLFEKRVHAISMATIWLFLFPISIFVTRYFKFLNQWMKIHIYIQGLGSFIGVLASALYVFLSLPENISNTNYGTILRPHSLLGIFVVAFTYVQGFFGIANRMSLKLESINIDRSRFWWVSTVHHWLGRSLLLAAFIQAGLGLNVLFPWEEAKFRGLLAWILYFIDISFWVIVYVVAEIYKQYRLQLPGFRYEKIGNRLKKMNGNAEPLIPKEQNLKSYTWKEIGEALQNGDWLVVAEGKYVIRIDSWINSHPGGALILNSVAGTDITQDYFNESGFDIESFIPKQNQKANKKKAYTPVTAEVSKRGSMASNSQRPTFKHDMDLDPSLITETEWKHVLRARRTHVHSRLAIQKLSQLVVGEISTNKDEVQFDIYEPRRYAIVAKTLESKSDTPIYRIKFSILYPFDIRVNQPRILPGQSVLIRYFKNGKYHQNYYTPINSELNTFEIFVKSYADGNVSRFLCDQEPGDRQFQISGPFGDPIVDPMMSLSSSNRSGSANTMNNRFSSMDSRNSLSFHSMVQANYDTIICITGGTGYSVSLALIHSLLLPTNVPLQTWQNYIPENRDEVFVTSGDYLMVFSHYYDGWCYGLNMTTNQSGVFPLAVTFPLQATKVALLNTCKKKEDIFGQEITSHALLSYPIESSILNTFTRKSYQPAMEKYGVCGNGRIDRNIIGALVSDLWDFSRIQRQKVIVVGPNPMQGTVVDLLLSVGVDQRDIVIFSNEM